MASAECGVLQDGLVDLDEFLAAGYGTEADFMKADKDNDGATRTLSH